MVSYQEILASNANLNDSTTPRVAVFVGGTSGIGNLTLRALISAAAATSTTNNSGSSGGNDGSSGNSGGSNLRIYLVGRPSARSRVAAELLLSTAHHAEMIWLEADISLLSETKRVCDEIVERRGEKRVDLLFLSAGYAPFGTRRETSEGIEIAQGLEFYSRVLFVKNLGGLLGSARGRVVSVLGGGLERGGSVDVGDLDLKRNFSGVRAQAQYLSMNTLGLEALAKEHPDVTFLHTWPGWVDTGNVRRGLDRGTWSGWVLLCVLEPLIRVFAMDQEEAAQRHLFMCTSAAFGGRGVVWEGEGKKKGVNSWGEEGPDGVFLVNYKCECTPNQGVMPKLREKALERVWEHTQEVLRPYM